MVPESRRRTAGTTAAPRQVLASWFTAFLIGVIALPAMAAPPDSPASPTIRLVIDGKAPVMLDHAALSTLPRTSVTAAAHHEPPSQWQGVALDDVLRNAGAPSGEPLRGHAMTTVVRVSASDHYQIVFSLAELDPMLGNEQVILADTQDGHPIAKDGPYRIVVPGDKRPARWIRNVTTIEVINTAASSP
jgi:hypothetical protein